MFFLCMHTMLAPVEVRIRYILVKVKFILNFKINCEMTTAMPWNLQPTIVFICLLCFFFHASDIPANISRN